MPLIMENPVKSPTVPPTRLKLDQLVSLKIVKEDLHKLKLFPHLGPVKNGG